MKFFIYGNGCYFDKVKEELANPKQTFSTIEEVFAEIQRKYQGFIDIKDLSVQYYCYDERIGKEVYMVVTKRCGDEDYIEKYGVPQFVSYLVNV